MLQPPISLAFREAMHTARLSSPLLAQTLKLSRPATAPQCRHMSAITTQATNSSPMLAFRTSRALPQAPTIFAVPQRRAESSVAANNPTSINADTTSTRTPPSTIATPASTSSTTSSPPTTATALTWNRFLALRAVRRRFNLVASISTSLVTTVAGIQILSGQDLEKLGSILFGIDPIMAMGLSSVGCGAVGWLLGPFAGGAVFGLWYRKLAPEIALVCILIYTS